MKARSGQSACLVVAAAALLCGATSAFAVPPGEPSPEESNSWQEALKDFAKYQVDPSVALDAATIAAVMVACGRVAKWFEVMELLRHAVAKNLTLDSAMCVAAANACAHELAWEEAVLLLEMSKTIKGVASHELLPKVVEACAGQPTLAAEVLQQHLEQLDVSLGTALLQALSNGSLWRESMGILANMRGQQLEISVDHLQCVMAACAGSRRPAETYDLMDGEAKATAEIHSAGVDVDQHPLEVLQLFCLGRQWRLPATAELYQTALGGLHGSGRFWAWSLHLLEQMQADGFEATYSDFSLTIEAVSMAEPKEATKMTEEERMAIRAFRARLAKIKPNTAPPRKVLYKFQPVIVDTPERFREETESEDNPVLPQAMIESERLRSNEPFGGGGPLRKWQMALSLLDQLEFQGLRADTCNLNHVLAACARAQELAACKVLLDTMHRQSLNADSDTFTSLIGGCHQKGLWKQALLLLTKAKRLKLTSSSTYNEALKACARGKQPRMAMMLLAEMDEGVGTWVASESITTAMATCAKVGLWIQAIELLFRLKARNLQPSPETYSAATASCAAGAQWQRALCFMEESIQQKQTNGHVFAAAVIACQNSWELVLSVLVSMRQARVAPIARTYRDVLRLFAAQGKATDVAVKFLEEPLQELGEVF